MYFKIKTEKCTGSNKILLVFGRWTGAHCEGFTIDDVINICH